MIVGTAGHIDHGKSSLVTALTGRAVDRLAEERKRGITIDLNFAPLDFADLPPVGIVDVPGHEDFVRTMVAGASGIDLVLLVVDAAEGPRPQTFEHLAIVEQLGVREGIAVVTKADLVAEDWLDLVLAELGDRLAWSPVRFGTPSVVSARTGQGIGDLRARLGGYVARAASRDASDLFRLPVDRVFSLPGVGTVVTGTAWSGSVRVGDSVRLLPGSALGRIRSIEMYGASVDAAKPGERVALGLAGVERATIRRGMVVVEEHPPWQAATAVDAWVEVLGDAPRPLAARTRVRVLHGTAEVLARVHLRAPLAPGSSGLCRLSLEAPIVVRGGDRFVLRSYSPVTTIGGGRMVDPSPPRRAPWPDGLDGNGDRLFSALVQRRSEGAADAELPILLGILPQAATAVAACTDGIRRIASAARWIHGQRIERARAAALELLDRFHQAEPSAPGLSLETVRRGLRAPAWVAQAALDESVGAGEIRVEGGMAARTSFQPTAAGGAEALDRLVEAIRSGGLEVAPLPDLARALGLEDTGGTARLAAGKGLVEQVERDRFVASAVLQGFASLLTEVGQAHQGEVTPAALRERTGLTRKYLIPLLEWADRKGITVRVGDTRRLR